MSSRFCAIVAALAVAACAVRPPLLPSVARGGPPGGDARVAFTAAAITSRTAHGRAFNPDTLVRVASVSKLVTTLGLMRLVEAGTLDLDHDVSDDLG